MARQIRKKSGTGIYHIMLRGIPLMIQSLEKVRRNEILITAKAKVKLKRLKDYGAVEKIGVVDGKAKYRKKNEMML